MVSTKIGDLRFKRIIGETIAETTGSGYDLFDKFGEAKCPVLILLNKLGVHPAFVQLWANVKATHTPMKEKLEEFLTANQVQVVQKLEEIYMTSNGSTAQMKKEMSKLLGQN